MNNPLEAHDLIIQKLMLYSDDISEIPKELFSNKDFISNVVSIKGNLLKAASEKLRADREVVLIAVAQYGSAFEFASAELRSDREFVLIAVAQCGTALEFASDELRSDREVVLIAVAQYGESLQFASDELRSDREVVLHAIEQQQCDAFKVASVTLRNDRDVVLAAVTHDGRLFAFVSEYETFCKDREVILNALKAPYPYNGLARLYRYLNYADEEILFTTIKHCHITDIFKSCELCEFTRNNRRCLLLLLQRLLKTHFRSVPPPYVVHLKKLNIDHKTYQSDCAESNLRISIFPGLALTINDIRSNELNDKHTYEFLTMGGTSYELFDIDKLITAGLLSIKIKEHFQFNDIVFVINGKTVDLSDYKKICIELFNAR